MKSNYKIIAEAVRIEYNEKDGKLFLVFEVIDEVQKKNIKSNWVNDIEYKLIGKLLIEEE